MRRVAVLVAMVWLVGGVHGAAKRAAGPAFDPGLLAGMKARSIGPAGMSGRVAAIEVVPSNPDVVYVGAATGGVWKSLNGGLSWEPLFDDQPVAAIGAVAVHPKISDIVWVGTGEGNPRNSASVGNGVYRSLDGGKTWKHLGLERSERIHRIRLHPADPQVAWVAAMGPTWGEGGERGIYKTTDGGESWKRVLYVNERTGAADLELDPTNPNKLIAALWEHRRWPWFFESGGPGSGIHLSYDGGVSWKRLGEQEGLPPGELGRIGLAIAASNPAVVYAFIEAAKHGIYRSDDGGETWRKVTEEGRFGNRPFYYADLRVDTQNPDRVYSLWSLVSVSIDGGKTWEVLIPWSSLHPDHHAMWIDPADPTHIWDGNDGGIGVSRDHGKTWRFVANLPLAQFYHVAVDDETPYNVYGGMQDNGSWRGPAAVWENGGIRNHHWEEVGFGDGFDTRADPHDSGRGYSMSQEGFLMRWDLETGERKSIRPSPPDPESELRFNWNAGLALDPFERDTLYYGSQFVHSSSDRGESWSVISPDLTSNNPEWQKQDQSGGLTLDVTGAENFTSIVSIAPSRLERGLIWVGTDDGRVHVTRDGGKTWTSLEDRIEGVPPHTWVPHIAPSHHDPEVAYVVFDDHRRSNWTPYAYRAEQLGRSWKRLGTRGVEGYALVIEEDPVDPDLLFLGTEFGLWLSLDRGESWFKWTHGVPTVSVMDLVIQPREHDLVLGTHGRAAYVLDDIRPLRQLTPERLAQPLSLFEIPDAQQYRVKQTGASRFPGHGEFRGDNEPYGALISFWLDVEGLPHPDEEQERARKAALREAESREPETETAETEEAGDEKQGEKKPEVSIRVKDATGRVIREFEHPVTLGLNRVVWDLRRDAFKQPPRPDRPDDDEARGPEVPPGRYAPTLKYGEHEASGSLRVLADPRMRLTQADREANWRAVERAGRLQEVATEAIRRLHEARDDLDVLIRKARAVEEQRKQASKRRGDDQGKQEEPALIKQARSVKKKLDKLERRFWTPPGTPGIGPRKDAWAAINRANWLLGSSWEAPTRAQLDYLQLAESRLAEVLGELETFFAEELVSVRREMRAQGLELLPSPEPLRVGGAEADGHTPPRASGAP